MGAIVLDAINVNSYVLPNLIKSKNTMQDAYSTSVSFKNSLPSSFRYRSLSNDIVNQLYNIKMEIGDINSIISKKIDRAKNIESKSDNRASKISSMVSKIGAVSGTIGGSVIGASSGITCAVVGGVVRNKESKTINDTGAKTASKVVSGVQKIGTSILDGFKFIGSKISNGFSTATKWVSEKAKIATDWVKDKFNKAVDFGKKVMDETGAFFSKTGSTIWNGLKSAWNWVTDIESWKKLGASISNGVISFVKGIVSLVEAIGDLFVILGSAVCTIGTALYDIGSGIVTGNWDWSATKGLWGKTKSIVSYNWTNKLFDKLYDTKTGKWLDKYAYTPFKSDGMGCQILEGVGYVGGVIAGTVLTFGVGGFAIGGVSGVSATTMSLTAGAAGVGKYTAEEWNKNSISLNYGGTNIDIAINYEKYSEIEKLKKGESTTISQQILLEDGSVQELIFNIEAKGNGEYLITDTAGNVANLNSLNESSTVKGLAVGGVKGAWEAAQWYVGGKIGAGEFSKVTNCIKNPILKSLARSGIRVGLDTATGIVEVPFQSLVTMMSEGKSWDEAWKSQGGWDAVKMQAGIAGLSSVGGEALDLTKFLKNSNSSRKVVVSSVNDNPKIISNDVANATSIKSLDEQIAMVNYHTGKGRFAEIKVNNLDEINSDILKNIDDPSSITFNVNGNRYSYLDIKEKIGEINLKPTKNITPTLDYNNKSEVDQLYRENQVKYKYIPGYDDYFKLQEQKRIKSNLDRASEILNEYGKKHGVDNYADKALRRYADTGSVYQNSNGKIVPYITNSEGVRSYIESLDPEVVSAYLNNTTLNSSSMENLNKFFRNSSSFYGKTYGVDQGGIKKLCEYSLNGKKYSYKQAKDIVNNAKDNGWPIPKFKKEATLDYFELKDKLTLKGLTNEQASIILSSLDDVGACSYAAKANSIFYQFSSNPILFEEKFGFPMYKVNKYGEKVLNSNELLLDMYLFANDISNGGNLFRKIDSNNSYIFYSDDRIDVFGRKMLNTENQVYMSYSSGSNNFVLEKYLNSKKLDWSSYNLVESYPNEVISNQEFNGYLDAINTSIKEGKSVQLNIFSNGNEIRMLNANPSMSCTTKSWSEGGGHSVFITGMNNQGFTVSSWGSEYLIPFNDLKNGGHFNIMIDKVDSMIY